MRRNRPYVCAMGCLVACTAASPAPADEPPAVTVYNQNFGVVRERVRLDLRAGLNEIALSEIAAHVEPDSVILRDPAGRRRLQILEQNYRSDPLSQELLLSLFEGESIDFLLAPDRPPVKGRIVRSGYVPHHGAWSRYGPAYWQRQAAATHYGGEAPMIEVDGQIRFGLPGTPLFPGLGDGTILRPTLHWKIEADADGPLEGELSYVTGGMRWLADYNIIAPPEGDALDLVGWVTIDNQSGRTFENARVKLMAGDVSKLRPEGLYEEDRVRRRGYADSGPMIPPVSEKAFDEYHLYALSRPTTLRDRETKQVEFVRAAGVASQRVYVYEGAALDPQRYQGWGSYSLLHEPGYGVACNPKVWVMREFRNCAADGLGMPLPAGRVRFYRQDSDGQLEFTGENEIDHTPADETVRVYTGNAFDLVGERRQTRFAIDHNAHWVDEEFEITLRNHKTQAAELRVVERLYRWHNWEVREKSQDFTRIDARTIEFRVVVPPDGEAKVTYLVHYSW